MCVCEGVYGCVGACACVCVCVCLLSMHERRSLSLPSSPYPSRCLLMPIVALTRLEVPSSLPSHFLASCYYYYILYEHLLYYRRGFFSIVSVEECPTQHSPTTMRASIQKWLLLATAHYFFYCFCLLLANTASATYVSSRIN